MNFPTVPPIPPLPPSLPSFFPPSLHPIPSIFPFIHSFVHYFCLRLKQDRLRQEQLARERLAQRRGRKSKEPLTEVELITDGDVTAMQENLLKILENKYKHEREVRINSLSSTLELNIP